MNKKYSKDIALYYLIAALVFISGYVFYLLTRGFDPLFNLQFASQSTSGLPFFLYSSYATFSHVLALALLTYALIGLKQNFKIVVVLFWAFINIIFELWQSADYAGYVNLSKLPGTFDPVDLLAVLCAVVLFFIITAMIEKKSGSPKTTTAIFNKVHSTVILPFVVVFGMLTIIASDYDTPSSPKDTPIYMTYEELRAPLKMETNRELRDSGKIYLYQSLLLVSEPNKGIHIYDNSDPANPAHQVFINLPGNLDIAVRNSYLYADSFIDLVVIDINNLSNISEVQRIKAVFPYNAYQAIEQDSRTFYRWDEKKGVIIGVNLGLTYEIN